MQVKANEDFLSEILPEDLKIKVEENVSEIDLYYYVLAFGNLNFKDKDFKLIQKENDQV